MFAKLKVSFDLVNKVNIVSVALVLDLYGALTFATQVPTDSRQNYYRAFWYPQFHSESLDYCHCDRQTCGQSVANQYCHLMGYDRAISFKIAHNVGLTRYLQSSQHCKGWNCDGFKQIRCVAQHRHQPTKPYYFRKRVYVYPRYQHYRIAWCYQDHQGCGESAARSFCRRMGY